MKEKSVQSLAVVLYYTVLFTVENYPALIRTWQPHPETLSASKMFLEGWNKWETEFFTACWDKRFPGIAECQITALNPSISHSLFLYCIFVATGSLPWTLLHPAGLNVMDSLYENQSVILTGDSEKVKATSFQKTVWWAFSCYRWNVSEALLLTGLSFLFVPNTGIQLKKPFQCIHQNIYLIAIVQIYKREIVTRVLWLYSVLWHLTYKGRQFNLMFMWRSLFQW